MNILKKVVKLLLVWGKLIEILNYLSGILFYYNLLLPKECFEVTVWT